jgi:hypothetical protein
MPQPIPEPPIFVPPMPQPMPAPTKRLPGDSGPIIPNPGTPPVPVSPPPAPPKEPVVKDRRGAAFMRNLRPTGLGTMDTGIMPIVRRRR